MWGSGVVLGGDGGAWGGGGGRGRGRASEMRGMEVSDQTREFSLLGGCPGGHSPQKVIDQRLFFLQILNKFGVWERVACIRPVARRTHLKGEESFGSPISRLRNAAKEKTRCKGAERAYVRAMQLSRPNRENNHRPCGTTCVGS